MSNLIPAPDLFTEQEHGVRPRAFGRAVRTAEDHKRPVRREEGPALRRTTAAGRTVPTAPQEKCVSYPRKTMQGRQDPHARPARWRHEVWILIMPLSADDRG